MSNFLGEVLQAKGNATLEELSETLRNLDDKISQLKISVIQSLNSTFVLYDTDLDRVVQWFTELVEIKNNLDALEGHLERDKHSLQVAHQDLETVNFDLEQCRSSISFLKALVDIVNGLERADASDYYHASQLIKSAKDELGGILCSLSTEYPSLEDHVWIKQLRARFSDHVVDVYDKCRKEWDAIFKFGPHSLTVNPGVANISHVVQSLKNINSFSRLWDKFLNLLWQELFKPGCSKDFQIEIIHPKLERDDIPVRDQSSVADVSFLNSNCGGVGVVVMARKLEKPYTDASMLFRNLTTLIQIVTSLFPECDEEVFGISQEIGPKINEELSNNYLRTLILHRCGGDVEKARGEVAAMQGFVNNLQDNLNFTFPPSNVFEDIENNFDAFFQNQVREALIVKIRDLIKSDLHNTEEIRVETVPNSALSSNEVILLRKHPASIPVTVVSKSILEVYRLLREHVKIYPDDSEISPFVFSLYLALVKIPKHEADAGELVPLTSVLTHNNSLFLAHHANFTFEMCHDIVPDLRAKASQAIAFMMRCVRTKLNELITTAMSSIEERVDRNIDITHDFLVISAELKRLNSVMNGVLPSLAWHDILATLVDHTVNEMCSKVLAWEDIPANSASELAGAFTQFAVATSSLFRGNASSPREVEALATRAVKKWQRFRLLIFVLTASMKEIETKWVQGCGPLAIEYTAEEVRRLVRALFQNTDRRADFLSRIK